MASAPVLPQKTDLQQVLECPLCLRQLENPRRLTGCFHSFCGICLNDVITATSEEDDQGIKCPVCKTYAAETDIKENSFLNDLIVLAESEKKAEKVLCKQCSGEPGLASVRCEDCKLELCENCKISHLKIPALSDHTCVNLNERLEKVIDKLYSCDNHQRPFDFNCKDCSDLLCAKCVGDHVGHSIEPLEVLQKNLIHNVKEKSNTMSEYCMVLEKSVLAVREQIEDTNASFENCKSVLDTRLEDLIEQMKTINERMKLEVTQQQNEAKKTLEKRKHDLECKLAKVKMAVNGHILFSGQNGLYYRTLEDEEDIQITKDAVGDISCWMSMVAAYKPDQKTVEIYELQDPFHWDEGTGKSQWKLKNFFQVETHKSYLYDTLTMTDTCIYLSLPNRSIVHKYQHNGQLCYWKPKFKQRCFLCGSDSGNNVTLCLLDTHEIMVITPDNACEVVQGFIEQIKFPLDVVIDSDLNVWVLQGNRQFSYRATKFTSKSQP